MQANDNEMTTFMNNLLTANEKSVDNNLSFISDSSVRYSSSFDVTNVEDESSKTCLKTKLVSNESKDDMKLLPIKNKITSGSSNSIFGNVNKGAFVDISIAEEHADAMNHSEKSDTPLDSLYVDPLQVPSSDVSFECAASSTDLDNCPSDHQMPEKVLPQTESSISSSTSVVQSDETCVSLSRPQLLTCLPNISVSYGTPLTDASLPNIYASISQFVTSAKENLVSCNAPMSVINATEIPISFELLNSVKSQKEISTSEYITRPLSSAEVNLFSNDYSQSQSSVKGVHSTISSVIEISRSRDHPQPAVSIATEISISYDLPRLITSVKEVSVHYEYVKPVMSLIQANNTENVVSIPVTLHNELSIPDTEIIQQSHISSQDINTTYINKVMFYKILSSW